MQVGRITSLEPYDVRTFAEKVQSVVRTAIIAATEPAKIARPPWDRYWIDIAHLVATRATCPRAQVGCVLVRDNQQLTSGYNGSPRHLDHCIDVGCLIRDGHCVRCLHAEQNAIIQAALHGVSTQGATCFVTHYPCILCAKMLINAGVQRVVYVVEYAPLDGAMFFEAAGIVVERLEL